MKLPLVDACVARLHHEITSPGVPIDTLWSIVGPPTAGKSTALRRLHTVLSAEEGLVALLVAPSAGALDAAPFATVEVGGGLHDARLINGRLEHLLDPGRPWNDKLRELARSLEEVAERVVVLCDDPAEWHPADGDSDHWRRSADDLVSLLLDRLSCRRVITQAAVDFRQTRAVELTPQSVVEPWLSDASAWGTLSEPADRLLRRAGDVLSDRTPLEIRLLVAVAALTSEEYAARLAASASRVQIADMLAGVIERDKDLASLRRTWATLALVRRSIPSGLLRGQPVDPLYEDILENCLLYEVEGEHFLHHILRDGFGGKWLGDQGEVEVHRELAQYYLTVAPPGDVSRQALTCRMEAMYHAAQGLDEHEEFLAGMYFVDQLDAMARTFSLAGRYKEAERLYRRSIALQPRNDYAHRFLAYNLERQGGPASEIESGYQEALRINPRNRWWWPPYIEFLVLQGRELDARDVWRDALEMLRSLRPLPGPDFYASFYGRLINLLLERGLLEFAGDILHTLPAPTLEVEPFSVLRARLEALIEVRDFGSYLPAPFVQPQWWMKEPPLLMSRLNSGHILTEWLAARVDAVTQEVSFSIEAARVIVGEDARPQSVTSTISWDKLDLWSIGNVPDVAVGDFIVIGVYVNAAGERSPRLHRLNLPPTSQARWDAPWTVQARRRPS